MRIRRRTIHGGERLDGRVEASGTITRNGRLRCTGDMAGKEGKQGVSQTDLGRPGESPERVTWVICSHPGDLPGRPIIARANPFFAFFLLAPPMHCNPSFLVIIPEASPLPSSRSPPWIVHRRILIVSRSDSEPPAPTKLHLATNHD